MTVQIKAALFFLKRKKKKRKPEGKEPSPEKARTHQQFFAFESCLA